MHCGVSLASKFYLVLMVVALVALGGCNKKTKSDAGSSSSSDGSAAEKTEFTLDEFVETFQKGKLDKLMETNKKYAGKYITVTGTVSGTQKFNDADSVILTSPKSSDLKFPYETRPKSSPQAGQQVRLRGKCDELLGVAKWTMVE